MTNVNKTIADRVSHRRRRHQSDRHYDCDNNQLHEGDTVRSINSPWHYGPITRFQGNWVWINVKQDKERKKLLHNVRLEMTIITI